MRILPLIVFFAIVRVVSVEEMNTYVGYDFFEIRRTPSDQRELLTQISFGADNYFGYSYREDIFGATTPTVRELEYNNDYARKLTAEEEQELVRALLAANVFDLKSDPDKDDATYFASLDVRIGKREMRAFFSSPPESPQRKAIHETLVRLAKRLKADQPEDAGKALTISEGDLEPAREVKLADLLANPAKYHGKRVSVVGYYRGEFEGSNFAISKKASDKREYEKSVWRGQASPFAAKADINDRNYEWLRIEGVFFAGKRGHMGLWPGEITRLTRIDPVPAPKE